EDLDGIELELVHEVHRGEVEEAKRVAHVDVLDDLKIHNDIASSEVLGLGS
ncbi:hypothetical protein AaE_005538, partial [Aphanomyces astaci]